jgi:hypothetical protein
MNLARWQKFLLCVLAVLYVTAVISYRFDYDLGWHLRFGRDALLDKFQFLDTYTWSYYGQPWVNHEWGGDILYWLLYSNFGYFSLVFFFRYYCLLGLLCGYKNIFFSAVNVSLRGGNFFTPFNPRFFCRAFGHADPFIFCPSLVVAGEVARDKNLLSLATIVLALVSFTW